MLRQSMREKKLFVIVDTMALAYKAYFAYINRPLSNSKGEPTSAVYGFLSQIFKILKDTKPDYFVIAFDSKEKTLRHERYEHYKSSREEMPEELIPQIARIKEIVEAFNFPLLIKPGYEADDLIGTAVKRAEEHGLESFAVTPDKDYIQLVTENVKILRPGKAGNDWEIIDKEAAIKKYGFEPKYMIDYLALVGDSSDDIPGVAGIGPKTATPLIQKFGTVESIYEHIDEIEKEGTKKKLLANKENAFLSKELATIIVDAPIEIDFEHAKFGKPDFDKLLAIFAELEFKSFAGRLFATYEETNREEVSEEVIKEEIDKDYKLVHTVDEAMALADKLSGEELFVFDTETNGLNTLTADLAGASFSVKEGEAYFVPVNPFPSGGDLFTPDLADRLTLGEFGEIFGPLFSNEKIKKVCQNGKFDISILRSHGIEVNNFYFDTMLASYVIDPDQKHNMDNLAKVYLDYETIPLSNLLGTKKNAIRIFDVELEKLAEYAAEDADITYRLYTVLKKIIESENLSEIAYKIEFPLVKVLERMERNGVKIDIGSLREFSKKLELKLDELTKEIYAISGVTFNINSTKQLQEVLFEKLNLPLSKKTKTGYSTDAKSLEKLRGKHEIIDKLLEYRQLAKLKSTYADALPKLINKKTKRIHTTYNQTVASTGRLSSIDPNLQNIPIRTDLGKEIRKAFIPTDKNHILLSADYSQIELRIMASISEDPALIKAFNNGEDIHRRTAALVFQVTPEEVTSDMRRKAKEVNFGILYGIGVFGLSNRLGIPRAHAKEIIDTYFETFKNVKKFMNDSVNFAKEHGFAKTLLGRRRFLRNINSGNNVVRQFEERVAINMPIQGTAADMIKIAMINIHNRLEEEKVISKMVLQVHDELVFDVHKDEQELITKIVKKEMENAMKLSVPLIVDIGIGNNWLEAH